MKFSKIWALSLLVLLVACSQPQQAPQVYGYDLMTLEPQDRVLFTEYSARIKGRQDIAIYPQVSGAITKVAVSEGDLVKKGETLFIIDQVPYQAALRTAEANVQAAEAALASSKLTYENKLELFSKNVISKSDLTMAKNSLLAAEASLSQAQAAELNAKNNLSYTVVKSPSNGVISVLPYKVGALVSANMPQPLTTVSDNSVMYVYFSVNENQLLHMIKQYGSKESAIKNMPQVELKLSDGSIYEQLGQIENISGVIDRNTGSVSVKAVFDNKNGILHSGASGSVIIPEQVKGAVVIPQLATMEIQEKIFAYKVIDGIANMTEVKVSFVNGGKEYIVKEGLKFGDVIVASGAGLVRNGARVEAVKAVKADSVAVKN
ncbi:MAG: efflux RND transporter periplasmic adaptor subunit [Bacteroidia bacterium]|nr:efflux RND transporter periplasmic adaptor subunit [Bacteroidia bacterium]